MNTVSPIKPQQSARWRVHSLGPIDSFWEMLPTVEQEAEKLFAFELSPSDVPWPKGPNVSEFLADYHEALKLAAAEGWEGDFTQGPCVLWLPNDDDLAFDYRFIWKQGNNGFCFMVVRADATP
jgi:hypothetical protein